MNVSMSHVSLALILAPSGIKSLQQLFYFYMKSNENGHVVWVDDEPILFFETLDK